MLKYASILKKLFACEANDFSKIHLKNIAGKALKIG
jgi:hypothetical protein